MQTSSNKKQNRMVLGLSILAVFTLLLILFGKVLFSNLSLYSLDQAPFFTEDYLANLFAGFQTGARFNPAYLWLNVMEPLTFHTFRYVWGAFLLFLSGILLLRSYRFDWGAAGLLSLGLAFTGYTFTLVSAGHNFTFEAIPYCVFMLGFIRYAFRDNRYWYLLPAAGSLGIALLSGSPDKAILFAWLALAFTLFNLIPLFRQGKVKQWVAVLIFGALGAGFAGLISLGTAFSYFNISVDARQAMRDSAEQKSGDKDAAKWEFATNWSLPPEDMLEFAAPYVRGIETTSPEQIGAIPHRNFSPYWGRLGEPIGWSAQNDKFRAALAGRPAGAERQQLIQQYQRFLGSRNYRQHTVYLGVVALSLGLFGFLSLFPFFRVQREALTAADRELSKKEVLFWMGALLVCLLFAMGRYTPFYKLFYMMPKMHLLRAPVKWVHLVEACLLVVAAYGYLQLRAMVAYSAVKASVTPPRDTGSPSSAKKSKGKQDAKRKKSKTAPARAPAKAEKASGPSPWRLSAPLLVLGFLFILGGFAGSESLSVTLDEIGRGSMLSGSKSLFVGSMLRAGFLFILCGLLPWLQKLPFSSGLRVLTLQVILIVVVSVDLGSVASRYIRTKDMSAWYGTNAVLDEIGGAASQARLGYFIGNPDWRDPKYGSFASHKAQMPKPDMKAVLPALQPAAQALWRNPAQAFELYATPYMLVGQAQSAALASSPSVEKVADFNWEQTGYRKVTQGVAGTYSLLKNSNTLPFAFVAHGYEAVQTNAMAAALQKPALRKGEALPLLLDRVPEWPSQPGKTEVEATRSGRLDWEMKLNLDRPGFLVLAEPYGLRWSAIVDGTRQPVDRFLLDHIGVELSAGEHTVTFTRENPKATLYYRLSFTGFLAFLGLIVFFIADRLIFLPRRNGADPTSSEKTIGEPSPKIAPA